MPADVADEASWQVGEPTWGSDPTQVDQEDTNVRWWPRRR